MRLHPLLAFATTLSATSFPALGLTGQAQAATTSRPPGALLTVNPNRGIVLTLLTNRVRAVVNHRFSTTRHVAGKTAVVARILHRFVPLGGVWASLRNCESAGNYGENTGNGYYGAYQFSLSTWRGLGNAGLPSNASPALQDANAKRLQYLAGWRPWPQCSVELGLA